MRGSGVRRLVLESRRRSAHRVAGSLYRLYLGLGITGLASVLLAGGGALLVIRPELPSASSIWRQCTQFATQLDPLAMAVLLALALTGTVIALGMRSTWRQLRADRQLRAGLTLLDTVQLGGGPVTVVADDRPEAFCMGYLRPRIYVSTGALDGLSEDELSAVLAHECNHLVRRDPLRMLVGRAAADALFFLPPLRRLLNRYLALAELAADEAAIDRTGAQPLASALLHFGEHRTRGAVVGIAAERVDHLGGKPARWRFSGPWLARWLSLSLAILASVLAGTLLLQGRSLSSTAVIAQACSVSMTGVPIVVGVMVALGARRRARAAVQPAASHASGLDPAPGAST
jgi:Zn-dependent protease with chaperone function